MPVTALRARARCSGCDSRLPPRTEAWWDEETRTATCLSCARAMGLLVVSAPPVFAAAPEPSVSDPVAEVEEQVQAPVEPAVEAEVAPGVEHDAEVDDAPGVESEADPAGEPGGLPVRVARKGPDDLPQRGVVRSLRTERTPKGSSGTVIRRRSVDPAAEADPDTIAAEPVARPPLPPREQVTPLRPSRTPAAEVAAARRFPSEGATAIEAEAEADPTDDDATGAPTAEAPATPPLRRAEVLPPDVDDDADDETEPSDGEHGETKGPDPRHVQSAADLIGRLRSVQRTTVQPAPRRGPLVVERPDPATDRGEIDDTRVTQTLEAARIHGVEVLHHRPVGADREVDHLVIAVNGIWTVVEQEKLTGPLEKRDLGDWFTADARLFIGDDDRTDLIETARAQAEAVRRVLAGGPFATVPVRPVVCFGTVPPGWVREPFVVGGVSVTWRNHLVEPMLDPVLLDRDARQQLIGLLVEARS